MNAERTEKCEMLKSELSQLALVLESNQVFAEPINPVTGEYLIRFVRKSVFKFFDIWVLVFGKYTGGLLLSREKAV